MTDHTEMQIPEDVMEAARKADHDFWAQDVPSGTENTVSYYVARAILAERERMNAQLKDCSKCGRKRWGW